ncbi:riboflavin synthase [Blattabacterium cuenoti]|uniref:riboflavin synthase n=1 Tax=Blattabacterium cuenoti TaxID=1653831 RepID=UPI00163B8A5A|nr:riboflavin synthase [Blattabacterium cuenoti]
MFTGVIECTTKVHRLYREKNNLYITFNNPFLDKIKINQSISHNGICFTIININNNQKIYSVIASEETLYRTNLNALKINDEVNLERGMKINERFNGHIVQGHIDTTAKIIEIDNKNGSWIFSFSFHHKKKNLDYIVVEKGSIAVNGISLTIVKCAKYEFSTSVIAYTYKKTNFQFLKIGDIVNIEFDILGKYISKYVEKKL